MAASRYRRLAVPLLLLALSCLAWPALAEDLAPAMQPVGSKTVNCGDTLAFTLSAVDPGGYPLFFSGTNLPINAILNPRTGYFNWQPTTDQAGNYSLTFTVANDRQPSYSTSETISVQVVNNPVQAAAVARIADTPLVFPSPFRPAPGTLVTIQYTLSKSADIEINIYSASAQMVKKLLLYKDADGGKEGLNKITWDGMTDFGSLVGNGIYVGLIIDREKQQLLGKVKLVAY